MDSSDKSKGVDCSYIQHPHYQGFEMFSALVKRAEIAQQCQPCNFQSVQRLLHFIANCGHELTESDFISRCRYQKFFHRAADVVDTEWNSPILAPTEQIAVAAFVLRHSKRNGVRNFIMPDAITLLERSIDERFRLHATKTLCQHAPYDHYTERLVGIYKEDFALLSPREQKRKLTLLCENKTYSGLHQFAWGVVREASCLVRAYIVINKARGLLPNP